MVYELGLASDIYNQYAGISQGCPLPLFLFTILMTILMGDATNDLATQGCHLTAETLIHDSLYADDTLLIDVYGHNIQQYMDAVISTGHKYGLAINWKKVDITNQMRYNDPRQRRQRFSQ